MYDLITNSLNFIVILMIVVPNLCFAVGFELKKLDVVTSSYNSWTPTVIVDIVSSFESRYINIGRVQITFY